MCQDQGWDNLAEAISPCYANPNPSVGMCSQQLGARQGPDAHCLPKARRWLLQGQVLSLDVETHCSA